MSTRTEDMRSQKRASLWAHAGPEPSLNDLLRDNIVITIMTKDKVSTRELLHLIWDIRQKIRE